MSAPSLKARYAAAHAVKAFLADVAAHYLGGRTYDHKKSRWGKQVWAKTIAHFGGRCVYCNRSTFPDGGRLTVEHLIEENQYQCGLHHPANTVPACSECNGSRDKAIDGSRLTWQQHLVNLGKKNGWKPVTIEKRRMAIQTYIDSLGYPALSEIEMEYLRKTAQALYQDTLRRCVEGTRGFLALSEPAPFRLKLKTAPKRKIAV